MEYKKYEINLKNQKRLSKKEIDDVRRDIVDVMLGKHKADVVSTMEIMEASLSDIFLNIGGTKKDIVELIDFFHEEVVKNVVHAFNSFEEKGMLDDNGRVMYDKLVKDTQA